MVNAKVQSTIDQLKADCDAKIMQAAQLRADSIIAATAKPGAKPAAKPSKPAPKPTTPPKKDEKPAPNTNQGKRTDQTGTNQGKRGSEEHKTTEENRGKRQ
jgi:hypothetical protein